MPRPAPAGPVAAPAAGRPPALEALALCIAVLLTARLCIAMPSGAMRLAPVWLPSALSLAVLLRREPARWPVLIAASATGHALAALSAGFPAAMTAVRVASAAVEYAAAAILIRKWVGPAPDMERARDLVVLSLVSTVCAVFAAGLQSLGMWLVVRGDVYATLRAWTLSHPLSLMMATPCLLVLGRPGLHLGERGLSARARWALAAMLAVALLVFGQSRFPLLFLAPPALMAVSLEAGLYGAALAVLLTAAVAMPATILGYGPVALSRGDVSERSAVLQLFLTVSLFSSLPIAALQARWRRAEAQARDEAERARRAEAMALAGEARHRTLTDKSPDAIGAMDMSGALTFISPAVEEITGYSADELTGRDLSRLIHADDLPGVRRNLQRLLHEGVEMSTPIEYRLRRRDGAWIWLQANPRIVRDEAGLPMGTVDVVRDVSARKAMELELATALREARAATQAKSDFLANMSHELRTPLTGILGYAEVLRTDAALPEASRRHAERIGAAGAMLLALVNDVLDLSRAEAGGLVLHPRPTDLTELVQASADMVRPQAQKGALALCVEHIGELAPVCVDAERLQQVLVNLLGNAVKFTRRGVVTVSLCGRRPPGAAPDALDVRLSVADTGPGIPEDRLLRIFDRFEQADGSISRAYGGAGLGLAISRTLVRAMGGEIGVESTVGAGSVFTVRLRLPLAEAAARPAASPPSAPERHAPRSGLRVLLAEDVAVNRDLIALMLAPLSVRLQSVADGAAAVEAAAAEAFDVILMDMQMPVMDGLEATRRIRAGPGPSSCARIVALTANVMPAEVERCLAAGMDDHLGKPLSAAALAAQLREGRAPAPLADAA